ncbi:uncharacterized protein [Montipora capricornis]|uniref:uncharacterized protein n=1 Tax=Montipora capricornis TaxID=246305 RepID=UPI0035F20304
MSVIVPQNIAAIFEGLFKGPMIRLKCALRCMSLLSLLAINIKYLYLTPSSTSQITILLEESLIEELTGWLTVNNGEIVRVEKPRKKNSTPEFRVRSQRDINGLWRDPIYIARKEALGCYVEDVREVMPICVVEDARKRWPNPNGVPYCGHRRS